LINDTIEQHISRASLDVLLAAEDSERELFTRIAGRLPEVREFVMSDKVHGRGPKPY
jgi:hypothetical protein